MPIRSRRVPLHRAIRGRGAPLAAAALLVATMSAGCSGDGADGADGDGNTSSPGDATALATTATIGEVRGRLGAKKQDKVVADVTEVIDGWIDAAYAGDTETAFASFTKDARTLAEQQADAVLGAGLIGAGVEFTDRTVEVDVLAPEGKVAGSTARINFVVEADAGSQVVDGRLLLSPAKDGWQVFGFDLTSGQEAS